ncbi:MAG: bifunctional folylpolyglutamate synthase/dihydrofolate synthase [Mariprofundaceae bacterium]
MHLKNRKPDDIASWLEQLGQPSADRDYKPGHQRMHDLLASFNLKRPPFRIRIAGTNGKGSTAFMLANALQSCGLNIGLYTSPHIHRFNERIRINGEPLSDSDLLNIMEELMPVALEIGASYFEVATALALKHFSDSEVDVEILEAGVGARLDATTAVDADMALITPIGLDHQLWLGDRLADIANEKAYVTAGCRFAITAPQTSEVASILINHYQQLQTIEACDFSSMQTIGAHQIQNASLAWEAFQKIVSTGFISPDMLDRAKAAIQETSVPGRLQKVVFGEASIWLDAAHNAHAVGALLPTLSELANPFDGIFIYTREDRDLSDSIDLLRPFTERVIGESGDIFDETYPTIEAALEGRLKVEPQGDYLILGSFITVAAALDWLKDNHSSS